MAKDKYTAVWVSPSSIGDFLKCPRAYYLHNVYKNPKNRRKINIVNPAFSLGHAVHDTLEGLKNLPVENRKILNLLSDYEVAWEKVSGKKGGFSNEIEEAEAKARGKAMIERVMKTPGPIARKTVLMPEMQDGMLPNFFLSEEENIILCGLIDWLEYIERDNSIRVLDFKTGKHDVNEDSLQLSIYLLLLDVLQKRRVSGIAYWYLDRHDEPVDMPLPNIEEARNKVLEIAMRIKEARMRNTFDCPKGEEGCFACKPYEAILKGHAEYAGVADNKRQDNYYFIDKPQQSNIYKLFNANDKIIKQKESDGRTEKEKVFDFLVRNPILSKIIISKYYSFTEELISRNEDKLVWCRLSSNKCLPLSIELIDRYKDKWDWSQLSRNDRMPWSVLLLEIFKDKWHWSNLSLPFSLTIELLEKYKDKWDWSQLSWNRSLPWSIELLQKYKYRFDKKKLSGNESLPFSIELVEKCKFRWDWYWVSKEQKLDEKFIEKHIGKIHWIGLSDNRNLLWSIELIEKYKDKWIWSNLSSNGSLPWSVELLEKYKNKFWWHGLSANTHLPWSIELLEQFEDNWEWSNICMNVCIPWSDELIKKYEAKLDWSELSQNKIVPWSIKLIEKYEDKWNWKYLSQNEGLPWSIELIERFKDNWKKYWCYLCENERLPWSIDLIEKYKNNWRFAWGALSGNKSLPWSIELIEKYEEEWNWDVLSANESLPWSIELLEKYEGKWRWCEKVYWSVELPGKYKFKHDLSDDPNLDFAYAELKEEKINFILRFKNKHWEKIIEPYINSEMISNALESIDISLKELESSNDDHPYRHLYD